MHLRSWAAANKTLQQSRSMRLPLFYADESTDRQVRRIRQWVDRRAIPPSVFEIIRCALPRAAACLVEIMRGGHSYHSIRAARDIVYNRERLVDIALGRPFDRPAYDAVCVFNSAIDDAKKAIERHGLRGSEYGIGWTNDLKKSIRQRDGNVCQICGTHGTKLRRALSVHHIDYNKNNHIAENLIPLCHPCHMKTNTDRYRWQVYFEDEHRTISGPLVTDADFERWGK